MRRMSRRAQKSKVLAIKVRRMMIVKIKMSKWETNDDCNDENEQNCQKIQNFGKIYPFF